MQTDKLSMCFLLIESDLEVMTLSSAGKISFSFGRGA
jgi:hypothetical protein